jgi:hypothetical protein
VLLAVVELWHTRIVSPTRGREVSSAEMGRLPVAVPRTVVSIADSKSLATQVTSACRLVALDDDDDLEVSLIRWCMYLAQLVFPRIHLGPPGGREEW